MSVVEVQAINGADASENILGLTVNGKFNDKTRLSLHLIWAAITGTTDGVVELQYSNDGSNWVDSGDTATITSADGSVITTVTDFAASFVRVKYTKNGVTGGTINAFITAK